MRANRGVLTVAVVLAAIAAHAAAPASQQPGHPLKVAPWVRAADMSAVMAKAAVGPAFEQARPAVLVETSYPAHDPAVNPDLNLYLSIAANGYEMPVTMYLYRQNRVTGEKQYFTATDGLLDEGEFADLFGYSTPAPVWTPTLDRLVLLGPSASAFGEAPSHATGRYQFVLELRDPAGEKVISRGNAMYCFVDQTVAVTENIDQDTTLNADNLYVLALPIFVEEGATLTVEPGTVILGDTGNRGTLIVAQGAKLVAAGTAMQPIIMTSPAPLGSRQPADWGGLILNGYAPINVPGGISQGEGDTGAYGGGENPDPADSSGVLRYLRVEFAGIEFSPDNELNGIAFQGVGSGTVVDHVQVHFNEDDGIEMFGGTVGWKHVLITAAADDSVDWTEGWQGKGQFVVVIQNGTDGDHGIEGDNWEQDNDAEPRSSSQIYNATFIGSADTGDSGDDGLKLRRGTGGQFFNWIVYGFRETGLDVDNEATYIEANNGGLVLENSIIGGNGAYTGQPNLKDDAEGDWQGSDVWFRQTMSLNRELDPGLASPIYYLVPDVTPLADSPALDADYVKSPPDDGFFEPVDFIGGVAPGDDWTHGWTIWSKN